jgi:uncharacterized protein YbjT (DUF2867 family)
MRTALLVGATGLTGSSCLDLLLEDNEYEKVTVLTRRPLPQTHDKLKQHVVDFDNLNASSDKIRASDVFCCLGTTLKIAGSKEAFRKVDFEYPRELASIASANGSEQYLVISAPESNPKSMLFYGQVKGEMEQAVSSFPFKGTYIFRPSLLIGKRDEFRWREELGTKLFTAAPFLLPGPLKKYRPIEARAVASAMIIVAKSEPGSKQVYASDQIQAIHDAGRMV